MTNREAIISTPVIPAVEQEPTMPSAEVSLIERQNQNPTLVAGDVQSMFALSDVSRTLNDFNRGLQSVQRVQRTVNQISGGFNLGNNPNNVSSERAQLAFSRELTTAAKNLQSANFQKLSPLEKQVWATNETVKLERLYSQMDGRSRELYKQTYNDIQTSLDSIRSGNPYSTLPNSNDRYNNDRYNPYNRTPNTIRPSTPRNTQTTDKADREFYTELSSAYREMNSPAFNKYTPEMKALWATNEAIEAQKKFNNLSPESQQKYQRVYQTFLKKLNSLGATSSMSYTQYGMQYPGRSRPEQNPVTLAFQPTPYELELDF
jgi:hypothetical protein